MHFSDQPYFAPGYCVATKRHEDPEGFVDLGEHERGHAYLSASGLREVAQLLGYPTKEEHQAAVDEAATLRAELDQAQEELAELRQFQQSVAYTFRGIDKIKSKPGPKAVA